MPGSSHDPSLTTRLEQQLADAGYQVAVEDSDGALILSGIVDTEEAREAAVDIVSQAAPRARIDNQIEVETILPTDVDDFVSDQTTAELADTPAQIVAGDGEIDPDFTDQIGIRDANEAVGPDSWGPDDPAETGEVYTPADDPVVTTDARGQTQVLGGFGKDSDEEVDVEPSASDNRPGDEALADAIRQELREDAATTDLSIVVAVRNGVAHLRGRVEDMDDADNAEAVAARVPGVVEVIEELEVASI
ncbi:MAG: BON domain-containing protein [Chloroflexi bacterium]|nr:BON domain-containing protein [Chloroflexota bacterium]